MRYPLLYVSQTLCKDFSLLSVLVSMIILHISYELFRWFYSIFRLKVCAVNYRFPTRARWFAIKYDDVLGVTGIEIEQIKNKSLYFTRYSHPPLFGMIVQKGMCRNYRGKT